MKFLVDAQLPSKLSLLLVQRGHESKHTLDLSGGNATTDAEILRICARERRVLITKDADFLDADLTRGKKCKLLLLTMGNITNPALLDLIQRNLSMIVSALRKHSVVELSSDSMIVRS